MMRISALGACVAVGREYWTIISKGREDKTIVIEMNQQLSELMMYTGIKDVQCSLINQYCI